MFAGFLIILELVLVGVRVAAECFSERIPFLGKLAVPLTWVCVILGIVCLVFIGIKIYREIKCVKNKSEGVNFNLNMNDIDWGDE